MNNTSIVYALGHGSLYNNLEIAASIRSLINFGRFAGNIFVIGDEPPRIVEIDYADCDIIHIPFPENYKPNYSKQHRIRDKILHACTVSEISDNFLFINDDHYFKAPVEIDQIPYYYSEPLTDYLKRRAKGQYYRAVQNTIRELSARKYALLHYDIHTPIIYNKFKFRSIMDLYDWKARINRDGLIIKSLYCNTINIGGVQRPDCCINEELALPEILKRIEHFNIWSTGNKAMSEDMVAYLKEYPHG